MEADTFIIRVQTDACRYRFELSNYDTYGKLLSLISEKTGIDDHFVEVYNQNNKRLNIRPDKRLKDIIYLSNGAILKVQFEASLKGTPQPSRIISEQNKNTFAKTAGNFNTKCSHSPSTKCLNCYQAASSQKMMGQYIGNRLMATGKTQIRSAISPCNHGPNAKCLKCMGSEQKKLQNLKESVSPRLSVFNTPTNKSRVTLDQNCSHSPSIKCYKCFGSQKIQNIIKTQSSSGSQVTPIKETVSPMKSPSKNISKCTHGPNGKCLNCMQSSKQQQQKNAAAAPTKQQCQHGENSKCIHCLNSLQKASHIPFDEFLQQKRGKCQRTHTKQNYCSNCLPPANLRLTVDKNCREHESYPKGICSKCMPQNVTIKRQEYRHVDYVQFMNSQQIHKFINYWIQDRQTVQMRVGFLYGYYAEDPFYKNGIRAIVEAIYEPEQFCTYNTFQIRDSVKRQESVVAIMNGLNLQKIGVIFTSCNQNSILTESEVRLIAKMQQQLIVSHSTGYQLSNFVTVIVKKKRGQQKLAGIEPEIYMISDQGQALQAANMFVPNLQNSTKMRIRTPQKNQMLPTVYCENKPANQFEIQFLLVKVASGASQNNKFSILKAYDFPVSGRGKIKKTQIKDYILKNKNKKNILKYSDINLLLFIAEFIDIDIAAAITVQVQTQGEIEDSMNIIVEKRLSALL